MNRPNPLLGIAWLLLLCLTPRPATAGQAASSANSTAWEQAGAAFQKGDWKAAADAYAAIAKREPGNGRAWYRLASSYARLGKLKDAVPAYLKADAIGQSPLVRYDLACAYARMGDSTLAFAWLEKAVSSGFRSTEQMAQDSDLESLRGTDHFAAVMRLVQQNEKPCAHRTEHRQLDFWIGDWQVHAADGSLAGRNSITLGNGDCWIQEHWTSTIAGQGESFNYYNATSKRWHQTWVDDQGEIAEFDGEYRDGAMRLEGYRQGPEGSRVSARLTLTPLSDGRVRQLGENSHDGGQTWTVLYDLMYTRMPGDEHGAGGSGKK